MFFGGSFSYQLIPLFSILRLRYEKNVICRIFDEIAYTRSEKYKFECVVLKMKIVLIHGQNHKGSSYHIGRMIENKLPGRKEVTEFFLPRDLHHFCVGCYRCIEDESQCPFYGEKKKMMDKVEEADLLIFTTPTYCMRASAPMKSFLDLTFSYWMVHKPRKVMFQKNAVVVTTAAGSGMRHALKDISNALFFWGIPKIKTYGVGVQAMNWAGVSDKKKSQIDKRTDRIVRSLQRNHHPKAGMKTKVFFLMMRKMQQGNRSASISEKNYWEKEGWLGKVRPWQS